MNTLKRSYQFEDVYKNGRRWHSKSTLLFYKKGEEKLIGLTATKRVGNAIKRNRAKRIYRAIFMEHEPLLCSGSYVFVAKNGIDKLHYEDIKRDVIYCFKKLDILK